ncbi:hypothetical protein HMPREF0168_2112 [Bifidobacterium dentium ATCC 27679]|uniref:Uncharacterized protein n=2 Tax=Bifidobacterium dentium TaxID=1689 RepID=E0QAF4_9BIFI|nr:hypothetical protein BIFDEN_00969 [Bifidobacterium dentium ATCC 27678]EFM40485.1 hypothetical protein HMPREF0168_2112 [Bifidobacterium dentium ATCC 27679]EFO78599.1 hypothetical protein HMPREF9003_1972 [Bifidobacterium dentium JCVIHMP022]ETO97284.1 hypothetical protein HMPREF1494_1789 [Bifidobacterium sp. MSTE12]
MRRIALTYGRYRRIIMMALAAHVTFIAHAPPRRPIRSESQKTVRKKAYGAVSTIQ